MQKFIFNRFVRAFQWYPPNHERHEPGMLDFVAPTEYTQGHEWGIRRKGAAGKYITFVEPGEWVVIPADDSDIYVVSDAEFIRSYRLDNWD